MVGIAIIPIKMEPSHCVVLLQGEGYALRLFKTIFAKAEIDVDEIGVAFDY